MAAEVPIIFRWWIIHLSLRRHLPGSIAHCITTIGRLLLTANCAIERIFRDRSQAGHCRHRSEEHTSELQSLMRISYAVFCLKKKKYNNTRAKQKQHHKTT